MRRRMLLLISCLGALSLIALLAVPLLVIVALLGASSSGSCGTTEATEDLQVSPAAAAKFSDMTARQLTNAAAVISTGRRLGFSDQGVVVALATASQESGFRIYANDGRGGDLAADQHGIEKSMQLPHEAVGTDHGSLGIFQQQWPWWGTMPQLMTPGSSATLFYRALSKVEGWEQLPVTVAAQRVQRSAFPSAYADDEPLARKLLANLGGSASSTSVTAVGATSSGSAVAAIAQSTQAATTHVGLFPNGLQPVSAWGQDTPLCTAEGTADDVAAGASGPTVLPLPPGSGYRDQHNWHHGGSHWGSWHTGTDLSVACGTSVLAANAGTVIIRTDQSWAGRWLVEISSGPTSLTTWYAHMRKVDVSAGQHITAGTQIGEVGDLGNATGCHLHFEVHTANGSIYGPDNVNPSTWLEHVGTTSDSTEQVASTDHGQQSTGSGVIGAGLSGQTSDGAFRLVTFNMLGNNHTGPGGNQHPTWASGPARMPSALQTLNMWGTDVAGLQEVQSSQRRALARLAGGGYDMFPTPSTGGDNRVIWRAAAFELVRTDTFLIPYFNGHRTAMPAVLLRQKSTGKTAWFTSVHNPAETADYHHQGGYRHAAIAVERAQVRHYLAGGHPVFLTGDLNDKQQAYCPMTAGGLLTSAATGDQPSPCRLGPHAQIDWIFAAGAARFSGYQVDTSPTAKHISDHPTVISEARID